MTGSGWLSSVQKLPWTAHGSRYLEDTGEPAEGSIGSLDRNEGSLERRLTPLKRGVRYYMTGRRPECRGIETQKCCRASVTVSVSPPVIFYVYATLIVTLQLQHACQ